MSRENEEENWQSCKMVKSIALSWNFDFLPVGVLTSVTLGRPFTTHYGSLVCQMKWGQAQEEVIQVAKKQLRGC